MISFRSFLLSACLFISANAFCQAPAKPLVQYVDPIVGTSQDGQTYPAVGIPHAMTFLSPQTKATEKKCISPYYYKDTKIQGFRASHWFGGCAQDYGSMTFMAQTGTLTPNREKRADPFEHTKESAHPDYYSVVLKSGIKAELTAFERSGICRFTAPGTGAFKILLEPNSDRGEGTVQIDPKSNKVSVINPVHRIYQGNGKYAGFDGNFSVRSSRHFDGYGVYADTAVQQNVPEIKGKKQQVGAYLVYNLKKGEQVTLTYGSSFVSVEAAEKNLLAEGPVNFEQMRKKCKFAWEHLLRQISIEGTETQKQLFYTAIYHAWLTPRLFNDADGTYPAFSKNKEFVKTNGFKYYDDFSMWDIYRSLLPLYTIADAGLSADLVNSLIKKAEQGGWIPIFPGWNNYTSEMIGDHSVAMMSDAIMKDIKGIDAEKAYAAMLKNAFEVNHDRASYVEGKGRRALDSYLKYHYIPLEDSVPDAFHQKEQVSRTLEYAYDDFALAQVARKLNKKADYDSLMKRASYYKNVFDTRVGYVRGRHANGDWVVPFDANKPAKYITEATPNRYTWYVPQDVQGLINLMGGRANFVSKLDSLFTQNRYDHGNEPDQQAPYMFTYAGQPWKTQETVRSILEKEYKLGPEGINGNDDAGAMSSWLALSMVGFYQVCPGAPYYVIGSPSLKTASIKMDNGKVFNVRTTNGSAKNWYIQSATMNGKPFTKTYLTHDEIRKGGELVFAMGSTPNKSWGTQLADLPPSMTPVEEK